MNTDGCLHITERVIGCAMAVSNALGCGFLEKVYEARSPMSSEKKGWRYNNSILCGSSTTGESSESTGLTLSSMISS